MKDVTLAIVVSNSRVGKIDDNFAQMTHWISTALKQNAQLICFPELNLTGYATRSDITRYALPVDNAMTQKICAIAAEKNISVLFGMVEKAVDDGCYASQVVVSPQGVMGVYRKLHIAPPEKHLFSAGDAMPLFEVFECKFGIQLCYDAHFPELSSQMAIKGADIIFMPHASPRGTAREKYDSWMRHLTARAYDNSLYVVAWNQVGENGKGLHFPGLSVVIGPSGKVIGHQFFDTECMMVVRLKADELARIRNNRMHFFLPHRRGDLY